MSKRVTNTIFAVVISVFATGTVAEATESVNTHYGPGPVIGQIDGALLPEAQRKMAEFESEIQAISVEQNVKTMEGNLKVNVESEIPGSNLWASNY